MRRAVPLMIATILGLGALATFKSTPGLIARPGALAPIRSTRTSPPTTAPPASGKGPKPTSPPKTAPPKTAPPRTAPPQSPSPQTFPPQTFPPQTVPPQTLPPPTPAPTAASVAKSYDGSPVGNPFGTVQVRVTIQSGVITGVKALQMPVDHAQSAYISQQAEPLLQQEALQAQSANIQILGGATYTSESYAQSLQSALDKAHF